MAWSSNHEECGDCNDCACPAFCNGSHGAFVGGHHGALAAFIAESSALLRRLRICWEVHILHPVRNRLRGTSAHRLWRFTHQNGPLLIVIFLIVLAAWCVYTLCPGPLSEEVKRDIMEADVAGVTGTDRTQLAKLMAITAVAQGRTCLHAKEVNNWVDAAVIMQQDKRTSVAMFNFTWVPCAHSRRHMVEYSSVHCPGANEQRIMETCVTALYETVDGHAMRGEYDAMSAMCIQHMQQVTAGYIVVCK